MGLGLRQPRISQHVDPACLSKCRSTALRGAVSFLKYSRMHETRELWQNDMSLELAKETNTHTHRDTQTHTHTHANARICGAMHPICNSDMPFRCTKHTRKICNNSEKLIEQRNTASVLGGSLVSKVRSTCIGVISSCRNGCLMYNPSCPSY